MQQLLRLGLDRRDDRWWAVPHRDHPDTAREIHERVAVDVIDEGTFGACDHHVSRLRKPARRGFAASLEDRTTLGSGDVGDSLDHGGYFTSVVAGSTSTMP